MDPTFIQSLPKVSGLQARGSYESIEPQSPSGTTAYLDKLPLPLLRAPPVAGSGLRELVIQTPVLSTKPLACDPLKIKARELSP